jgi:hypothetical protein
MKSTTPWIQPCSHGGGYSYRLCKYERGVNMTEACFQQTPLDFLPTARLVWMNGTSLEFNATLVNGAQRTAEACVPVLSLSGSNRRRHYMSVLSLSG